MNTAAYCDAIGQAVVPVNTGRVGPAVTTVAAICGYLVLQIVTRSLTAGVSLYQTGGGANIFIGYRQVRMWGAASVFCAGQTFFTGGGLDVRVGAAVYTTVITYIFSGAGANTFVGSGTSTWIGFPQHRDATVQGVVGPSGGGHQPCSLSPIIFVVVVSVIRTISPSLLSSTTSPHPYFVTIAITGRVHQPVKQHSEG
jgi:hypothetical protein